MFEKKLTASYPQLLYYCLLLEYFSGFYSLIGDEKFFQHIRLLLYRLNYSIFCVITVQNYFYLRLFIQRAPDPEDILSRNMRINHGGLEVTVAGQLPMVLTGYRKGHPRDFEGHLSCHAGHGCRSL